MSHYSDTGTGLPVVLMHGFANDRTLWRLQAPLASRYRIIAPDLRGFGSAPPTDGQPVSMDAYGDDIVKLLDQLGIERAVIGGISLGGYVTMSIALRHPGRVLATVMANTRAIGDNPTQRANRDAMAADVAKRGAIAVVDAFGEKPLRPDCPPAIKAEIRSMNLRQPAAGLISATLGMRDRPDRTAALGSLRVPTLVIHGTADVFIPPADGEAIQRAVDESTFVNIPGAGHLSNIDSADAFNAALDPFLADVARRHAA
jgi:3-oxoadipate enol-lactonase